MNDFQKFRKTIIGQILITAAIVAAVALFLGYKSVAKGFVLGSLFSLINFLIMSRQAPQLLGKERKAATATSGFNLLIRMAILAVPLYLAIHSPELEFISTVIGILNFQFSVIVYGFIVQYTGQAAGPTI